MPKCMILICLLLIRFSRASELEWANKDKGASQGAATEPKHEAQADKASGSADDILSIGAVRVSLGMSSNAVLSELGKYYSLQTVPYSTDEDSFWLVLDKSRPDESLGEVRFHSGKLTWASKDWTHENKQYSGADAAEIIYRIFSELEGKGVTNCVVRTLASQQSPGPGHFEFRETQIVCGHRQVEIILSWRSGSSYVQVSEIASNEPL